MDTMMKVIHSTLEFLGITDPPSKETDGTTVPTAYTRVWCTSHNFENSLLFDFRGSVSTRQQAYLCLQQSFGDHLLGAVQLRPLVIRVVLTTAQATDVALHQGVQCGKWRVIPTVVLDSSYPHTILKVKGLPFMDEEITCTKLIESLTFIDNSNSIKIFRVRTSVTSIYEGVERIIIRGEYPIPRNDYMYLSAFKDTFPVEYCYVPSYCHLCDQVDRHRPRACPLLLVNEAPQHRNTAMY